MRKRSNFSKGLLISLILLSTIGCYISWQMLCQNRGAHLYVEPQAIATAETNMWRAYYARDKRTLGTEMTNLLREQFGLSYQTALLVALDLSEAAMAFARSTENYHELCLPGLISGYTSLRDATDSTWDPQAVAEAELEWWIARRTPGKSSPEYVGRLIAKEYTLLYGANNEYIEKAGLLRAHAGAIRDKGRENANWAQVENLLLESYQALLLGVELVEI